MQILDEAPPKLMSQIFDPLPSDFGDGVLCCYVNATSKIQIVRITNVPNWYFERVVFPGQRLIFEALSLAMLEVHTGMMASAILSDTIPCERLRIEAELESSLNVPDPLLGTNDLVRESLATAVSVPAE